MAKRKSNPDNVLKLITKLRGAVSGLIQDTMKDATKYLIIRILEYIFGAAIFTTFVSFSLRCLSWLQMPVTLPAWGPGLLIVTSILAVSWFRRITIESKSRRSNRLILGGLLFKLAGDNRIFGPLCVKCERRMVMASDQVGNAIRVSVGKRAEYTYTCKCGNQTKLSISVWELLQLVEERFRKDTSVV